MASQKSLRHAFGPMLLVLAGMSTIVDAQEAAPAKKKETFKPVPTAGNLDYTLQGEYLGWQQSRPSTRSSEPVGLQIYCPEPGKFAAVKYYGGLPGSGWFGGKRFEYRGERVDDIVRLGTDDYEYTIEADGKRARIYAADGRLAGELRKVERVSPTAGLRAPPEAIVLFDHGKGDTRQLVNAKVSEDGFLLAGTDTVDAFGDFQMHVEFRIPFLPYLDGQNRGNSGVYIQNRYELQILDTFALPLEFNHCASLYRTLPPSLNVAFPPYRWQTYDIDFQAARFDDQGNKTSDATFTIRHNGILVHDHIRLSDKTGRGKKEGPDPLPTKFQDHQSPVEYRNLWIIPKGPSVKNGATVTSST